MKLLIQIQNMLDLLLVEQIIKDILDLMVYWVEFISVQNQVYLLIMMMIFKLDYNLLKNNQVRLYQILLLIKFYQIQFQENLKIKKFIKLLEQLQLLNSHMNMLSVDGLNGHHLLNNKIGTISLEFKFKLHQLINF